MRRTQRVTVLAGGVGAARFLRGLHSLLDPRRLIIIGNTGDDDTFFGLHVSPDLDTVTYTLAGRVGRRFGWGVQGDTLACLHALERYYAETWFQLGDMDLATHLYRTDALRRGQSLSEITRTIAQRHGLKVTMLPMSDDPVRTVVHVAQRGALPFQQYLVKGRGRGRVERVQFVGASRARPAHGVLGAIRNADIVIVPPSNPIVSIGPIVSLAGVRAALRTTRARIAAISPIVGGMPIKGPAHRLLRGLGHEVSPFGVANIYRDFVDLFVLDNRDAAHAPRIQKLGMRTLVTDTIMSTPAKSRALAAAVVGEVMA
ncbi:MAG: 2-phospho-L-lactate transferase [Deltaproteobacteria bacterium]|nr:2-phospho-L-lactate transferase [Deltaproteobacteria bacterium]MBI3389715.1 2-phospho-L-lactate transferase [Deltaproteobacteria bacterium]